MSRVKFMFSVLAVMSAILFSGPFGSPYAGNVQLVKFGADACHYCRLFDRTVAPTYKKSRVGKKIPLAHVDLDRQGTAGYPVRQAVTVTPTFVMFKNGREVGRITGFPGKRNFYKLVQFMSQK